MIVFIIIIQTTKMIQSIIYCLLSLLFILVSYVLYQLFIKIYLDAAKFKKMDPNLKVFIAPFSGLLGVQKKNVQLYGDSHRFVKDMIKQNPEQQAYLTNFGNRPFLILCDAKLIKELSLNPKKFKKYNMFKHSQITYTKGIFFAENQDWTKQRNIIRHSFNHDQLKKMIPVMNSSINAFIQRIQDQIKSSQSKQYIFNVVSSTELLIGQILVRSFFSQDATTKKVGNMSLTMAMAQFSTQMFNRSRTGANMFFSLFVGQNVTKMNFSRSDRDLQKLILDSRTVIEQLMDQRIKNIQTSKEDDFMNHYIKQMFLVEKQIQEAERQGKKHNLRKITREQIIHQLISFYFAGIDTTGHLVAMSFYALAEFPDCKKKIIDQIKQIIPTPQDITYEKLQQLQYTQKFLDQCLRMWPPAVGILARVTVDETKIGPYTLPKDMAIGTNIIGLMHNQKYFQNPEVFNPERWDPKGLHASQAYSFIPFSAGPRSCIGKYLALMEAKLIAIQFLYKFQISRTNVPLRMYAKFLYQPVQQNLVILKEGGMQNQ